jgi:hypothetical protein
MKLLLISSLLIVLVFIFLQDLKERAVNWYFFPLLLVFAILYKKGSTNMEILLENICFNVLFLFIQLGMLSLYFSLKKREWTNITREYLGVGDILFLLVIAPLFTPVLYILFYVISLFLIVLATVLIKMIKDFQKTIPLAGLQSLMLGSFLLTDLYLVKIDDSCILNYLYK